MEKEGPDRLPDIALPPGKIKAKKKEVVVKKKVVVKPKPVEKKPVVKKVIIRKVIVKRPVEKQVVEKKPVVEKPVVKKVIVKKVVAKKPVVEKQVVEKPVVKKEEVKPEEEIKTMSGGTGIGVLNIILLTILVLLVIVGALIYLYAGDSEGQLGINIEEALVSADGNNVQIKLTGKSDEDISKVKFSFVDLGGEEYHYKTSQSATEISAAVKRSFLDKVLKKDIRGEYIYQISAEEIGLEDFQEVIGVRVLFEYETLVNGETLIVETPILDIKELSFNS